MKRFWIIFALMGALQPAGMASDSSREISQLCQEERAASLKDCLLQERTDVSDCEKEADESIRFNPGCDDTTQLPTLNDINDPAVVLQQLKAEATKDF